MSNFRLNIAPFIGAIYLSIKFACPVTSFFTVQHFRHTRSCSLEAYLSHEDIFHAGSTDWLLTRSYRNETTNEVSFNKLSGQSNIVRKRIVGNSVGIKTSSNVFERTINPTETSVVHGLVTNEGEVLYSKFGSKFTPLERIVLTANGNLQRIFSSFYGAPVHVRVNLCSRRKMSSENIPEIDCRLEKYSMRMRNDGSMWDRAANIIVHGKVLYKASSVINIRSSECIRLMDNGSVGIAQLFQHLNKSPTFSLLDAGRTPMCSHFHEMQGGVWRVYELRCEELTCLILEEFHKNAWNLSPNYSRGIHSVPLS